MNKSDYDYPMSWSCWRSICQQNGWEVPPPDREPEFPSHEEHEQSFIKMQELWRNGIYPALHDNVDELYQKMLGGYFPEKTKYPPNVYKQQLTNFPYIHSDKSMYIGKLTKREKKRVVYE